MMRRWLLPSALLMASLLFCITASAAYIVSYWDGPVYSKTLQVKVTQPVRRCGSVTVYRVGQPYTVDACTTQWGSISTDGMVRVGQAGDFHKVALPANQSLMADAGITDRLYVSIATPGGYEIGYYENMPSPLTFNTAAGTYSASGNIHILTVPDTNTPIVFTAHGFSNNSQWLIGVSDGRFVRVELSTGATIGFNATTLADPDAVYTPTISNNGSYVLLGGANYWQLAVYDLWYCGALLSGAGYGSDTTCTGRIFSDEELGGQYPSNPEFNDDGLSFHYNVVVDAAVDERLLWTRTPLGMVAGGLGVDYVALGDSYQSGEGDSGHYLSGTDGTSDYPKEKCHVSTTSYSARLSSQFAGDYFSVACSGAVIGDVTGGADYKGQFSQVKGVEDASALLIWRNDALLDHTPGRIPQVDFVSQYHPAVVTLGVGGNDIGFKDVLSACAYGTETCDQASRDRVDTGLKIHGLYQKLIDTYRAVLTDAPGVKLYVVGYPLLFKENSSHCAWNAALDGTERRFTNESVKYLNQVIKAAAYSAGAYYVDIQDALGDEALCGSNGDGLNGLVAGDDIPIFDILGLYKPKLIGQESFHPTARGHELIAAKIASQYGNLATYTGPPCPDSAAVCAREAQLPNIPLYLTAGWDYQGSGTYYASATIMTDNSSQAVSGQAEAFALTTELLQPASRATLWIASTPQQLGTYTVNANGLVSGTYTLPDNLSSGYHTLIIDGLTPDGQKIRYEQIIYVYNPKLPPAQNSCGGIVPVSGLDQDGDDIDDACDPQIATANQQIVYSPYDVTDYGATPPAQAPAATSVEVPAAQQPAGGRYVTIADMLAAARQPSDSSGQTTPTQDVNSTTKNPDDTTSKPASVKTEPGKAEPFQYALVGAASIIALITVGAVVMVASRRRRV